MERICFYCTPNCPCKNRPELIRVRSLSSGDSFSNEWGKLITQYVCFDCAVFFAYAGHELKNYILENAPELRDAAAKDQDQ